MFKFIFQQRLPAIGLSVGTGIELRESTDSQIYLFFPILYCEYFDTEELLISEVLFNPLGEEPDAEWVELLNYGDVGIDLSGYKFGDAEIPGDTFEGMMAFPDDSFLNPRETIVIVNTAKNFFSQYGFLPDYEMSDSDPNVKNMIKYVLWTSGNVNLNNESDEVQLINYQDKLVDSVSWGKSIFAFNPPLNPVNDGVSIERYPPNFDSNQSHDWRYQGSPDPGHVDFSPTQTPIPTITPTPTPTITSTPSQTPTTTPSLTPTYTGTPTVTATPKISSLLISEIVYDPIGAENDGEWIEIFNAGDQAINLYDFKLGDEETIGGGEGMFQFPQSAVIGPSEVLIIAVNGLVFSGKYGFYPDYEFIDTGSPALNMIPYEAWSEGGVHLSNSGDEVLLLNGEDQPEDALSWGDSHWAFSPPCPLVAEGHSLERFPPNIDTNTSDDWRDQPIPNPGDIPLLSNNPTS
jgi:hypothetical protein